MPDRAPATGAGYALSRAASETGINLARLVSGSEGTLALVLQAVLKTVPLPAAQGVVVLPFGRLADAAAIGPASAWDRSWTHPSAISTTGGSSAWPATPTRGSAPGSTRRPSRC